MYMHVVMVLLIIRIMTISTCMPSLIFIPYLDFLNNVKITTVVFITESKQ